ncbi:phage integrase central domain-containing protein, partial [Salmonella enterica subsp. enterica serovar Newport]|nr:integrase [Salmonella enterica subsp. enterica serovar Litchfield]
MSQKKYDANLPKNLTYRRSRKTFAWRNPLTNEEIQLGQISRRDAIAQAIEANHFIAKNYTPVGLIEKLKGTDSLTVTKWAEQYEILLKRRNLSANTYKIRGNQLETIKEKIGRMLLIEVSTRHIAEFLETWIAEGKNTMAGAMRSVLSDMFREAIVRGHIAHNPVEPTRSPKIEVARDRLRLDVYNKIREAAEQLPAWFPLAMDLALVTGQRREDLSCMKFSHIIDERLYVKQIKTGMKIALPLSLNLPSMGLRLS